MVRVRAKVRVGSGVEARVGLRRPPDSTTVFLALKGRGSRSLAGDCQ